MAGKLVHIEFPAQDTDRGTKFYSQLFGWQFQDSGMPGIDYRMFQGEPGGAVYAAQSGEKGPVVYFDTDEIDGSVSKVRELGGQAEDKQPIPGIGWFSRCQDTEGNSFSFFQSDESVPPPQGQ
jgi:uncharacterized protein